MLQGFFLTFGKLPLEVNGYPKPNEMRLWEKEEQARITEFCEKQNGDNEAYSDVDFGSSSPNRPHFLFVSQSVKIKKSGSLTL